VRKELASVRCWEPVLVRSSARPWAIPLRVPRSAVVWALLVVRWLVTRMQNEEVQNQQTQTRLESQQQQLDQQRQQIRQLRQQQQTE
jgi:uncharacterized membrane-anchored protein YhcB (DUF1043 family)